MELVNDFVMPETARKGRNGSMYLTEDTIALMEKMQVGQGFILPSIGKKDTEADRKKSCQLTMNNFPYYAKLHFKGKKEFQFGRMTDDSGIACRCTKIIEPVVAPEQA